MQDLNVIKKESLGTYFIRLLSLAGLGISIGYGLEGFYCSLVAFGVLWLYLSKRR